MIKKLIVPTILIISCVFLFKLFGNETILFFNHPKRYTEYIEKYSKEYNIDDSLLYAVIKNESGFYPFASSRANCKGLMQISEETFQYAKSKIDVASNDIFNKQANIQVGAWYLSHLLERFDDEGYAILAYNAGPENVASWISKGFLQDKSDYKNWNVPFAESRIYIDKVLTSKKYYEQSK